MKQEEFNKYYDEVSGRFFTDKSRKDDFFKYYLWEFFQEEIEEMRQRIEKDVDKMDQIFMETFGDFLKDDPANDKDEDIRNAGIFDVSIYERLRKSPKYALKNEDRDIYDKNVKETQDTALFNKQKDGTRKALFNIGISFKYMTRDVRKLHTAVTKDFLLLQKIAEEGGLDNAREEVTKDLYERMQRNISKLITALKKHGVPKQEYENITRLENRINDILDGDKNREELVSNSNRLKNNIRRYSKKISRARSFAAVLGADSSKMNLTPEQKKALEEQEKKTKEIMGEAEKLKSRVSFRKDEKLDTKGSAGEDVEELNEARDIFLDTIRDSLDIDDDNIDIQDIENDVKQIYLARDKTLRMIVEKYVGDYSENIPDAEELKNLLGGDAGLEKKPENKDLYDKYCIYIKRLDAMSKHLGMLGDENTLAEEQKTTELFRAMAYIQGSCEELKSAIEKTKNKEVRKLINSAVLNVHDFTIVAFGYIANDLTLADDAKKTLERCKNIRLKTDYKELQNEEDIERALEGKDVKHPERSLTGQIKNNKERTEKEKSIKGNDEMLPKDPLIKGKVMGNLNNSKGMGKGF